MEDVCPKYKEWQKRQTIKESPRLVFPRSPPNRSFVYDKEVHHAHTRVYRDDGRRIRNMCSEMEENYSKPNTVYGFDRTASRRRTYEKFRYNQLDSKLLELQTLKHEPDGHFSSEYSSAYKTTHCCDTCKLNSQTNITVHPLYGAVSQPVTYYRHLNYGDRMNNQKNPLKLFSKCTAFTKPIEEQMNCENYIINDRYKYDFYDFKY